MIWACTGGLFSKISCVLITSGKTLALSQGQKKIEGPRGSPSFRFWQMGATKFAELGELLRRPIPAAAAAAPPFVPQLGMAADAADTPHAVAAAFFLLRHRPQVLLLF
jgi:hypothetical protein